MINPNILKRGPWKLTDLKNTIPINKTVFSCFHCGGGSSMGYKLAGYNVLGGVEIDPRMMALYRENHKPKNSYLMGVEQFNKLPYEEIPKELFGLDVLDGSPPCSSFSMAGAREKKWGKASKFREGQSVQILDDLFFHFIDTAKKLMPKVVVAENVKGLVIGNARGYVKEIFQGFNEIGYETQLFLLNAASMGVPQARERTFFIARRKDLNLPKLELAFNEKVITAEEAIINCVKSGDVSITEATKALWSKCKPGDALSSVHEKKHRFNWARAHSKKPLRTLVAASERMILHWSEPRSFYDSELIRFQSFPDDYNFLTEKVGYVCGMSVPPFMMQRVATEISNQLLLKT